MLVTYSMEPPVTHLLYRESVSNFGRSVIHSLSGNRLFDVEAMNPDLVRRVARLRRACQLRRRAAAAFPFVLTCRECAGGELSRRAEALSDGLDLPFTLNELCLVKLGTHNSELHSALEEAVRHVLSCESCKLRGHLCEGCRSPEVIFPFQRRRPEVRQCAACGACFHAACYERCLAPPLGEGCGRCRRMRERRTSRMSKKAEEEE